MRERVGMVFQKKTIAGVAWASSKRMVHDTHFGPEKWNRSLRLHLVVEGSLSQSKPMLSW